MIALSIFLLMQDKGEIRGGKRGSSISIPVDLKLAGLVAVYSVSTLLVMGLISLMPLIMVRAWGVPQAEAASVVGTTRLAGLAGVIVVGLVKATSHGDI